MADLRKHLIGKSFLPFGSIKISSNLVESCHVVKLGQQATGIWLNRLVENFHNAIKTKFTCQLSVRESWLEQIDKLTNEQIKKKCYYTLFLRAEKKIIEHHFATCCKNYYYYHHRRMTPTTTPHCQLGAKCERVMCYFCLDEMIDLIYCKHMQQTIHHRILLQLVSLQRLTLQTL